MATRWYPHGLKTLMDEGRDNMTFKWMLCDSSHLYNATHQYITSVVANEIVATNYTGGFAGAGRKSATVTIAVDTGVPRVEVAFSDVTWTGLGGATNDSVSVALLIREVTTDADSDLIAQIDFDNRTTNGSDATLAFDADGNLRMTV